MVLVLRVQEVPHEVADRARIYIPAHHHVTEEVSSYCYLTREICSG